MSDEQTPEVETEEQTDARIDMWAVIIMFTAAIAMAMHFVSGFTFDL